MSVNLLSIRGLGQSYPAGLLGLSRREVLVDVSLELAAGERVLIAGPNGSGKSTLLRILAGVEAPGRGSATLRGEPIDSAEARRRIGYAPDGCPFPLELSAKAMMRIVGELAGLRGREARTRGAAMLARVGLEADARRRLGHFSKGMQRRFTLGAALLAEPELLLLDEPTDGLDAEGFGVLDQLLDEARARGAGVLFASHVAALACDRVHILWNGRIAKSGPPAELVSSRGGLLATYAELAAGTGT